MLTIDGLLWSTLKPLKHDIFHTFIAYSNRNCSLHVAYCVFAFVSWFYACQREVLAFNGLKTIKYHIAIGRSIIRGGRHINIFMFCIIGFFWNELFSRCVHICVHRVQNRGALGHYPPPHVFENKCPFNFHLECVLLDTKVMSFIYTCSNVEYTFVTWNIL